MHFKRAAAPRRPEQGPTRGHEEAASWPREDRSYPVSGVSS